MYMSIRTLDYVIFSHQANLSKTTKHWDGFVSHCKCFYSVNFIVYLKYHLHIGFINIYIYTFYLVDYFK